MNENIVPIMRLADAPDNIKLNGSIGQLIMADPSQMFVDMAYQRNITTGSARRVKRIAESFDWNKFIPVIGVQKEDGIALIDGQHRATAAISIGIKEIPCYLLNCTDQEAAAAFASINGDVTSVSTWDIWFAEIASGDEGALAIQKCLEAANVKVTRRKSDYAVGETRAVSVLRRAYKNYGESLFITILQCITETRDGNPGMIIGSVVNGIGRAIRTKPDLLANPSKLFDLFDGVNLQKILERSKIESAANGNPVQYIVTRKINEIIKGTQ